MRPYTYSCYNMVGGVYNGKQIYRSTSRCYQKIFKNIGEYKLRVSKEEKEKYMNYAKSCGISLNTLIIEAVNEKIEREVGK